LAIRAMPRMIPSTKVSRTTSHWSGVKEGIARISV
jgi:hypothetical protein